MTARTEMCAAVGTKVRTLMTQSQKKKKNAERDFFSGIKGAANEMRGIKRM